MWTFQISKGSISDRNGDALCPAYAGNGEGKNNITMQQVHGVGPLPCGTYEIEAPVDTVKHGPYVLWLTPDPANQMFGRSQFGIHGDSAKHPGQASEGCIVAALVYRQQIWNSGDHFIQVIE